MVTFTDAFRSQLKTQSSTQALRAPQLGQTGFDPTAGFPQPVSNPSLDLLSGLTSGQAAQLAAPAPAPAPQLGQAAFDPTAGFPQPTAALQPPSGQSLATPSQEFTDLQRLFRGIGPAASPGFQGPIQPVTQTIGPSAAPLGFEASMQRDTGTGFGDIFNTLITPFDAFSEAVTNLSIDPIRDASTAFTLALLGEDPRRAFTGEYLDPSLQGGRAREGVASFVENFSLNPLKTVPALAESFRERPFDEQLFFGAADPFLALGLGKAALTGARALTAAPDAVRATGRALNVADEALAARLTPGLSPEAGVGPHVRPANVPAVRPSAPEIPPQLGTALKPAQTPGQRLADALKDAPKLRTLTEQAQSRALKPRVAQLAARQRQLGGEAGASQARGALAGPLPSGEFESIRPLFDSFEIGQMFDDISLTPVLRPLETTQAHEALTGLLANPGVLPTRSQINLLGQVFGKELQEALLSKLSLGQKAGELIKDLWFLPRQLKSSIDASFPLRQGILNITRGEFWRSFKPMFEAMANPKFASEINDQLSGGPVTRQLAAEGEALAAKNLPVPQHLQQAIDDLASAQLAADHGVRVIGIEGVGGPAAVQEEFISGIPGRVARIPGSLPLPGGRRTPKVGTILAFPVKSSEAGFTTFGNYLRRGLFDNVAERQGRYLADDLLTQSQHDQILDSWGDWVNIGSGQASLSEKTRQGWVMKALRLPVWSPQLLISRLQAVDRFLAALTGETLGRIPGLRGVTGRTLNPAATGTGGFWKEVPHEVRIQILRDIGGTVATGTAVLTMLSQAGIASVELDPRSSNWGKAKVGSMTFDPWGGFQQIARYATQLITGDRKALASGNISEVDRIETALRFVRSKLDPGFPALIVDATTGKTFLGEDFDFSLMGQFRDRFVPLSPEEIFEAFQEEGLLGLAKSIPGPFGVGVNTIPEDEFLEAFREATGQDFFDLESEDTLDEEGNVVKGRTTLLGENTDLQALSDKALRESAERGSEGAQRVLESKEAAQRVREVQQASDDRLAPDGEFKSLAAAEQWRDERSDRLFGLRQVKDQIFAGLDSDEATTTMEKFYAEIEAQTWDATVKDGTDWDAVDAYVAGLDDDERNLIEGSTGLGGTVLEQEYRKAVEIIAASGYWEVKDDVYRDFFGKPWGKAKASIFAEVKVDVKKDSPELDNLSVNLLTNQIVGNILGPADEIIASIREGMRTDPELLKLLLRWGYKPPADKDFPVVIGQ